MSDKILHIDITDEDIKWAESILPGISFDDCRKEILKNLESVDIHACPGSGKTTLLVAKLAILAKKWTYSNKGICVLSHTNVAREEIQERLGKLDVGKKLLSYPHFIGTFQSFLHTFISIPILKSMGTTVSIVDTDFVTERGWNALRYTRWLESKYKNKDVCDPIGFPNVFDVTCDEDSNTYKDLKRVARESRKRGEFTFREMELLACKAIEKRKVISDIIQSRFPILFIDEAQDTRAEIWNMIEMLYKDNRNKSIYQAYGDENQAIFDSIGVTNEVNVFPRENSLQMLNSKRFGNEIASFANCVAIDKRKMVGEAKTFKKNNIKHTVFLFDEGMEEKVIEAYANFILESFTDNELLENEKYGCHVLGMVHKLKETEEPEHAMRVSNYFKAYNPDCKKNNPSKLIDYFYVANERFLASHELSTKIEYISKGILKLIKKYPKKEVKSSSNAFKSLIDTVEDFNKISIRKSLLDIISTSWHSENEWKEVVKKILTVFKDIINQEEALVSDFIEWYAEESITYEEEYRNIPNQMIFSKDGRNVNIKFGSIHSAKGRTHLATLVVETSYYDYNMKSILPWIIGKNGRDNARNRTRLKCQYVAMTRAKGLLCLAIPKNLVTEKQCQELKDLGWNIEKVIEKSNY